MMEGGMGTVGLSFGSPTSGQGFDVSSTVAAIVANLQNVETPWKTQLATLQGQDTAISSLGTLFSKLSNDLSSLTDLEGILSQKTGSSSDTNVLSLTAANSTAIAGTHSIQVSNLAQTSSGYLAPITNASDTLSGSITLQAGTSGTSQTITLNSSDNTLAGLAATINSSGVGVNAAVLTDSSGSRLSLVSGKSGAAGNLTVSANSIVDASNSNAALAYTAAVTGKDANLTVDGVSLTSASNTVANLIPGVTFQLLAPSATESDSSLEQVQVIIGNDNTDVESTVNQFVSDYNAVVSAVNTQEGDTSTGSEALFGSPTLSLLQQQLLGGLNTENPNGSLDAITTGQDTTLAGSISIAVGSGQAQAVSLPPSGGTLDSLAAAINSANIGVTATVVTNSGKSTLSLLSQTEGSSGALSVSSSIVATSDTALSYIGTPATLTQNATGTLTSIPNAADVLTGGISIQAGAGAAQTFTVDSSDNTLAGLASAINTAAIGVTASVVANSNGSSSLSLLSQTAGAAGNLNVTSNILDTTNTASTTLNYTNSSDINSLTALGISVNNDGSIALDATSLDSLLNSDYSGFVGFFQNANGWGQAFSTVLNNAGTSSVTGVLALNATSNSNIESTLNADITKENSLISAQQKSLTAELTSANQIMQELPSQLDGVNELYSAVTGYNENANG
jgi:flagellar hook-associated protein 2